MIRWALAPVAEMTTKAAAWGEHDLSRRFYAGEPHDELTRLAATFDELLERLAQSLRREQRFTAEMSHELRTPLAKIVAEAELTAGRDRQAEDYRAALRSIGVAGEQLGGALDALLAAARTETAGTPSAIDARRVAERAADAQRAVAERHGVAVEVGGAAARVRVGSEPELIERALAPIIENAVRHAERIVRIRVDQQEGQLLFVVSDDGPGVGQNMREQIFEPGVTGTNGAGSGAGLGLPLARRLARAAGGDVRCDDSTTGASFTVRFPIP
jgi:signal transduction histidine kinase